MNRIVKVEDFEPYVGAETVERILGKAKPLRDLHVAHVNSTYYGGGEIHLTDRKKRIYEEVIHENAVRDRFLMTSSVERYLDLFASFETAYKLVKR